MCIRIQFKQEYGSSLQTRICLVSKVNSSIDTAYSKSSGLDIISNNGTTHWTRMSVILYIESITKANLILSKLIQSWFHISSDADGCNIRSNRLVTVVNNLQKLTILKSSAKLIQLCWVWIVYNIFRYNRLNCSSIRC